MRQLKCRSLDSCQERLTFRHCAAPSRGARLNTSHVWALVTKPTASGQLVLHSKQLQGCSSTRPMPTTLDATPACRLPPSSAFAPVDFSAAHLDL